MTTPITARHDSALTARIVRHTPLLYAEQPDAPADRPAFVRAGSSLTCIHDYVVVVQDNANYLALVNPQERRATCLPLPAGPHGERVFDNDHGNKQHKFDLEACVTIPGEHESLLIAFGSGSQSQRERIVVVHWPDTGTPTAQTYDASAWYAILRSQHEFAGSELNVEGAVFLGNDRIRLYERGNGKPHDDLQPVDATGEFHWSALWAHLNDQTVPPPILDNIVQYDLGTLDDQRLNFSDAEAVGEVVLFSASAEASESVGEDGAIGGSVLGVIDAHGVRWARLTTEDDRPFAQKIEGLSVGPDDSHHIYFVVDDDKDEPSALFEVELSGPWFPNGE